MADLSSATPCPVCEAARPRYMTQRMRNGITYHLARCCRCGQHYCDPAPTADEIRSFYEGDYHQELRTIGGTEREFGNKYVRYRDWIVTFIQTGRTIDIGTATGMLPALLKGAGFQAEGVEYSRSSAEWGSAQFGVPIRIGGAELVAQETAAFDLISMTDVLEHTEHPLRTLQSLRASLKPYGLMLITFPDIRSAESRYEQFMAKLAHRKWLWSSCHIPLHVWEFTHATACRMFELAGFQVVGFRRSQIRQDGASGLQRILRFPLRILNAEIIAKAMGTQMEFVIRRID